VRRVLSVGLLVAVAGPAAAQQPAWRAAVDSVFLTVDRTASPGCALGVVQRGELIYARGYGMASLESGTPITPETALYIASTSKQFTAAAISLLAREGTLDLDGSLRRWFPELPAWADSVTPRMLVHHTSGIRDYLSLWSLAGRGFHDAVPIEEALAMIARQRSTNFPPGTQHLYSNSGYLLMALLVERVSGQPLSQFSAERFFQPAGMTNTRFRDNRALPIPNRADGHIWDNGGWQVFRTSFDLVGDGGLVTTVSDLARWERWFWEDPARAEFRARVLERGRLRSGDSLAYAFGLAHGVYRGQRTVAHGGAFLGFLAELLRFPDQHTSIIVLCNTFTGNPSGRARQVADAVLAPVLGERVAAGGAPPNSQTPTPYRADSTAWRGIPGRYTSPELEAVYTITAEKGVLRATVRQSRRVLTPAARDTFRMQNASLAFTRGRDGRVTGMVLSEGRANGIRFERLPTP
jgi:CubicO group peptidase (beta-lactamase class C family)